MDLRLSEVVLREESDAALGVVSNITDPSNSKIAEGGEGAHLARRLNAVARLVAVTLFPYQPPPLSSMLTSVEVAVGYSPELVADRRATGVGDGPSQ